MSYDSDNGWIIIPVGLLVFIIGVIALAVHGNIQIINKECTCNIPKNEIMYSIIDDKGNIIKQVSKSELKQLH